MDEIIKKRLAAIDDEHYPYILDKKLQLKVPVGKKHKGAMFFGGYGKKKGVKMMWSVDCDRLAESQYSIVTALRKKDKKFIEDQKTKLW